MNKFVKEIALAQVGKGKTKIIIYVSLATMLTSASFVWYLSGEYKTITSAVSRLPVVEKKVSEHDKALAILDYIFQDIKEIKIDIRELAKRGK